MTALSITVLIPNLWSSEDKTCSDISHGEKMPQGKNGWKRVTSDELHFEMVACPRICTLDLHPEHCSGHFWIEGISHCFAAVKRFGSFF